MDNNAGIKKTSHNEDEQVPDCVENTKAASDVMVTLRRRTLQMLRDYRAWRRWQSKAIVRSTPLPSDGALMREQIRDMYYLYRASNLEYHNINRCCREDKTESLNPQKPQVADSSDEDK
jgi:hypothetical protein